MADQAALGSEEVQAVRRADGESRSLAANMPRLVLEARRISATVIHGLHGRRRAGAGESFWQYRRFASGEPAQNVDWRRSARDDHLYVREQELGSRAHRVAVARPFALDGRSSRRSRADTKLERALIVGVCASPNCWSRAANASAFPGLMRRRRVEPQHRSTRWRRRCCTTMASGSSLPPSFVPSARSEIVILSDLWAPLAEIRDHADRTFVVRRAWHAGAGRRSRREGASLFGPRRIHRARRRGARSPRAAPRPGRADYDSARRAPSRRALRHEAGRLDWLFSIHRTDRPRASELLLYLHSRHERADGGFAGVEARDASHDRRTASSASRNRWLLLGLVSLPVLWWLLRRDAAAAAPRRISADAASVRRRAEGGNAVTHAMVADAASALLAAALVILAAAGPIWNPPDRSRCSTQPLVLLIDDGWSAAASWDTRIKAADELIASAENRPPRRRARAAVGSRRATSRCMPAGAARVALRQLAPKPLLDRSRRRPAGDRRASSQCDRRRATSSGCPTASTPAAAADFVRRPRPG